MRWEVLSAKLCLLCNACHSYSIVASDCYPLQCSLLVTVNRQVFFLMYTVAASQQNDRTSHLIPCDYSSTYMSSHVCVSYPFSLLYSRYSRPCTWCYYWNTKLSDPWEYLAIPVLCSNNVQCSICSCKCYNCESYHTASWSSGFVQ